MSLKLPSIFDIFPTYHYILCQISLNICSEFTQNQAKNTTLVKNPLICVKIQILNLSSYPKF